MWGVCLKKALHFGRMPITALAVALLLLPSRLRAAPSLDNDAHQCGGELERSVWDLWDTKGRAYARDNLIGLRLLRKGDVYALYDVEITFHNLVAMAVRCRRHQRIVQFAKDWGSAFSALEALPRPSSPRELIGYSREVIAEATLTPTSMQGKAWVCRGGSNCNATNRLLGSEVELASAQGLAIFVNLANRLSDRGDQDESTEKFIAETANAVTDHLRRWGSRSAIQKWNMAADIRPGDVRDGQSRWFFTDLSLWQIGIYADLAGLLETRPALEPNDRTRAELKRAITALLALMSARLSYRKVDIPGAGNGLAADLDRGYWRNYKVGRYAGYEGALPPAACKKTPSGRQIEYDETVRKNALVVQDLGWDISHARRLVHVLDALERNRNAMMKVYGLTAGDLPPKDLAKRFAAQLLVSVWNRNEQAPLFRSWMNGANGWYRVAYDNGTGRCVAGFPPFGLTSAYATGGYITWARYYPLLAELGQSIYAKSQAAGGNEEGFIRNHYPALSVNAGAPSQAQVIARIQFWPTLVAATKAAG